MRRYPDPADFGSWNYSYASQLYATTLFTSARVNAGICTTLSILIIRDTHPTAGLVSARVWALRSERMGAEGGLRRRVKGLSEAGFRARFGTETQCRAALFAARPRRPWGRRSCGDGSAALRLMGQGLGLPGLRPWPLCCARQPCRLAVQPLQAPGRADRRDGVPLDQIAADDVVPGDLPPDPEQGRDVVGRAGPPAGHTAADRLAAQAQADGGDGSARGHKAQARRPGRGRRRLSRRRSARAASAAAVPPARRRSWPPSRRRPSASPGGCA